jgi:predicted nucleic acid-binding protein
VLTHFNQLELLQGCRNEQEWSLLQSYLHSQDYLEMTPDSWESAARIYYDLRRQGFTVRSPIDCCIAQAALDHKVTLIHCDRDFDTISQVRPLQHHYFRP